jgi:hypothetical protein
MAMATNLAALATEKRVRCICNGVKLEGVFYTEDVNECDEEIELLFRDMFSALNCSMESDLTAEAFIEKDTPKATLTEWLERCCDVIARSREVIRAASNTVDKLKSGKIEDQQTIIRLQGVTIKKQSDELQSVHSTVQTELRSYGEAVKKTCKQVITPKNLKAVVREAVERDDRGSNLMIYGLKEEEGEELKKKVSAVLGQLDEKPHMSACSRVGKEGSDKPVKITLRSSAAVRQILAKSGRLSKVDGLKKIYLSPDRSREEREIYRKLTQDMKQQMKDKPERYYFIRNRKVCYTDRRERSPSSEDSSKENSVVLETSVVSV